MFQRQFSVQSLISRLGNLRLVQENHATVLSVENGNISLKNVRFLRNRAINFTYIMRTLRSILCSLFV